MRQFCGGKERFCFRGNGSVHRSKRILNFTLYFVKSDGIYYVLYGKDFSLFTRLIHFRLIRQVSYFLVTDFVETWYNDLFISIIKEAKAIELNDS